MCPQSTAALRLAAPAKPLPTYKLPAPIARRLAQLAAELGCTQAFLAERVISIYLEVLDATEQEGGLNAWLERIFEVKTTAGPRQPVALQLPAWQVAALISAADADDTSPEIVLAAMLGRTLEVASRTQRAVGLPRGWSVVVLELISEHAGDGPFDALAA